MDICVIILCPLKHRLHYIDPTRTFSTSVLFHGLIFFIREPKTVINVIDSS